MIAKTTPAYITTVGPDRTITLPEDMDAGTVVAVVVMSPLHWPEESRQKRFETTLTAIRAASTETSPSITDTELSQLIKQARKSATTAT